MLPRNVDAAEGLANGTRTILVRSSVRVLDILIVTAPAAGKRKFIPRVSLDTKEGELPLIMQRRQFPVRWALCMTINKAQRQTSQHAVLYLPEDELSHGQLYMAASRARLSALLSTLSSENRLIFFFSPNLAIASTPESMRHSPLAVSDFCSLTS